MLLLTANARSYDQSFIDRFSYPDGCTSAHLSLKHSLDNGDSVYYLYTALTTGTERYGYFYLSQIDSTDADESKIIYAKRHTGINGIDTITHYPDSHTLVFAAIQKSAPSNNIYVQFINMTASNPADKNSYAVKAESSLIDGNTDSRINQIEIVKQAD